MGGWSYSHADLSRISRKDAVRREIGPDFLILKDRMIGTTYYGAIKSGDTVFALIVLTRVENRDWFNFGTKFMDETCGPYSYDCPKSILDLLSPTDCETANEWRRICRARGNT